MRTPFRTTAALLMMFASSWAFGGPVRDFEAAFRDAYADYRTALFTTNSKDPAAAGKSLAAFESKWSAIIAKWGASPPPHYADDPLWPETLRKVSVVLRDANSAMKAGKLADTHEILEHFREEIGALHARNDVATFSDRMNAYHEKMEKVLGDTYGGFDTSGRDRLREDNAVLMYLADDLERYRPKEAIDSAEFRNMLGALRGSLAAIRNALGSGDAAAIKKAVTGLKPAYSKFFLRFG